MAQDHGCFMYEAAAELKLTFEQEQLWRDLRSLKIISFFPQTTVNSMK